MRTDQTNVWQGDFGREYTDRNPRDVDELNALYTRAYGVTRTQLNESVLSPIGRNVSILEVGSNVGAQLLALQAGGFTRLSGIELQRYAIRKAREALPDTPLVQGSALALPFEDNAFDLVFTSGVLIHISPGHLGQVMDEIFRVTRKYIWGFEYFSEQLVEIQYRGRDSMMWKANFARLYLQHFPTLELIGERHVPYLEGENQDSMFLLAKKYT